MFEVGFDFRTAQTLDPCMSGDSGIKRPMGALAQGGEQVGIADQDQGEGGLLGQVESQKHPDIFQRAHGIVTPEVRLYQKSLLLQSPILNPLC